MTATILVPVKDQLKAKSRMSPALSMAQRADLAWAMFMDLNRALQTISAPVVLVTDSPRAEEFARTLGWRVLFESIQISESRSVDEASSQLASEGCRSVLRLPADLPLIQSQDILDLLSRDSTLKSVRLVPSRDRLGTNAILRTPPDLFPSRFGHNSLVLHIQEALRTGARIEIVENSRLALDLDDETDIAEFLSRPSDTETFKLLSDLNHLRRR